MALLTLPILVIWNFYKIKVIRKILDFLKTIKSFKFLLKKMENIQYFNIDTDRTHFTWFRDRFIFSIAEIGLTEKMDGPRKWTVLDNGRFLSGHMTNHSLKKVPKSKIILTVMDNI